MKLYAVVDSNELKDSITLLQEVKDHPDIEEWRIGDMKAGDLALGPIEMIDEVDEKGDDVGFGPVGIERKTLSDYTGALLNGRLTKQRVKMRDGYPHRYFLIESDMGNTENPLNATYTRIKPQSIRGSMASITARDKTPVVMVGTTELLVDYATRLARKHLEDSDGLELPKSAVKRKEPTAKRMYGCIEGIGPEGAQTLYERWPSIAQFMSNADVDEIRKLDGFGKKTAEMVMDGFL